MTKKFQISKTVQLGIPGSNQDLCAKFGKNRRDVDKWGGDILREVEVSSQPTKVNLTITTSAELGYPNGGSIGQIYTTGREFGLKLCSGEVAPQFCLQNEDLPEARELHFAMKPLVGEAGLPRSFAAVGGAAAHN